MKATDAIRVERQIPQPPGQPAHTVTEVVCPRCLKPPRVRHSSKLFQRVAREIFTQVPFPH